MRESCTYGSVRGARGNSRPYRDRALVFFRRARAIPSSPAMPIDGYRQNARKRRSRPSSRPKDAFGSPHPSRLTRPGLLVPGQQPQAGRLNLEAIVIGGDAGVGARGTTNEHRHSLFS